MARGLSITVSPRKGDAPIRLSADALLLELGRAHLLERGEWRPCPLLDEAWTSATETSCRVEIERGFARIEDEGEKGTLLDLGRRATLLLRRCEERWSGALYESPGAGRPGPGLRAFVNVTGDRWDRGYFRDDDPQTGAKLLIAGALFFETERLLEPVSREPRERLSALTFRAIDLGLSRG